MKKIVIVEDDVFMREELTDILQKAGYSVSCITRFSQTVADILAEDAGLVLLDLNLPGTHGFDICRQIRQSLLLSENEGKILEELVLHRGEVVTKEELFQALWGTTEYVDENALQVNMTRLRHTLKRIDLDQRVKTIRGVGYQLLQ